ncbi:MAG: hypothetical protein Q4C98_02125, partial [Capnocytophaga sp.]|nr:hypothetical protein [Capnocytophaga sp.]
LTINLEKKGIAINGVFMEQFDPEKMVQILGEPRKSSFEGESDGEKFSRKVYIWDDLGLLLNIPTAEKQNFSVEFTIQHDEKFQKEVKYNYFDVNPTGTFTGIITVEGKNILDTLTTKQIVEIYYTVKQKIGNFEINFELTDEAAEKVKPFSFDEENSEQILSILKAENQPYKDGYIVFELPKEKKKTTDKYKIPKIAEEVLVFDNFNFKLAVIEELMYNQKVLKPAFDVFDFCENYTQREIDPEDYYFEPIPEVQKWFEDLPIPASLAPKVTELYFDGGNEIYMQIIPYWDGEDDFYDIKSLTERELSQFKNLKTIDGTALLMTEEVKAFFRQNGVEVVE